MIKDQTLDEAIVEAMRFVKAAKALRAKRKDEAGLKTCRSASCYVVNEVDAKVCKACGGKEFRTPIYADVKEHAACKRASLDLTRKLADLRTGR